MVKNRHFSLSQDSHLKGVNKWNFKMYKPRLRSPSRNGNSSEATPCSAVAPVDQTLSTNPQFEEAVAILPHEFGVGWKKKVPLIPLETIADPLADTDGTSNNDDTSAVQDANNEEFLVPELSDEQKICKKCSHSSLMYVRNWFKHNKKWHGVLIKLCANPRCCNIVGDFKKYPLPSFLRKPVVPDLYSDEQWKKLVQGDLNSHKKKVVKTGDPETLLRLTTFTRQVLGVEEDKTEENDTKVNDLVKKALKMCGATTTMEEMQLAVIKNMDTHIHIKDPMDDPEFANYVRDILKNGVPVPRCFDKPFDMEVFKAFKKMTNMEFLEMMNKTFPDGVPDLAGVLGLKPEIPEKNQ